MDSLALLEESLCTELFTNLELSINKLALITDEESKKHFESKEQMIMPLPATFLPVTVLFTGASYEKQNTSRKASSPVSHEKGFSVIDTENPDVHLSSKSHTSTNFLKKKHDGIGDLDMCHNPVGIDLTQLQCRDKALQTNAKDNIALENKYSLQNFVKSVESYYQEKDNSQGKTLSMKRSKLSIQKRKQRDYSEDNNEMKKEENERAWFPCKKCHFEFSTAKGLANHVKTHPKKMIEKNSCVYCRKCLDDEEALRNHLHAEHIYEITNYTCESCKIECISGDIFDKHQYFCHRNNSDTCFLCANCDKVYYNEELYAFHKEQQKYCHICSVNFCMSSEQYKTHKAKHILHMYKCPKCNASFITKAALTKHLESKSLSQSTGMKSCTFSYALRMDDSSNILDSEQVDDICLEEQGMPEEKQKEKLHSCPICSSTFIRIKNLLSHMAAVHPEDIQDSSLQNLTKHECTKCDKKFTKKSNLLSHLATHIRDIGCDNRQPTCSICHKTFRLQRYLVDHMRLHTGRGTHQCPHCAKKFLRISHLKLHMEMHDNFHKSHSCTHCNKKYMRKQDLMQHIRVKHNTSLIKGDDKEFVQEKGFPCSRCSVCFPTTLKLRMHEVTHIVSKPPFKCQECSKEFMSLSALKRHYMIHWDIKPFTCITCKRRFRYSQGLQRHMVTHTGEKAHKCNHCGKSFALKGTLHTHMQQHNTQKIFTCSKCGDSFTNKQDQKVHFCRHNAAGESTDISCPEYNVFNKAIKYMECGQIDSNRCDEQIETVDEQLGNIVSNTLSDMTEVTHLITDNTISDMPSVAELVPSSMSTTVGQLIAHVSGNIVCLNESVPDTSFQEMLPQIHKNSDLVEEILEHSNSDNTFENSTILEEVSNIPQRHDNDVLSQAFGVMGDSIMTECVNLDSQTQLPSSLENTGTESTIYTLVSVDGDTSQPVLINIPSVDSAGAEENVTLQINFPENGCSEVFIIKG